MDSLLYMDKPGFVLLVCPGFLCLPLHCLGSRFWMLPHYSACLSGFLGSLAAMLPGIFWVSAGFLCRLVSEGPGITACWVLCFVLGFLCLLSLLSGFSRLGFHNLCLPLALLPGFVSGYRFCSLTWTCLPAVSFSADSLEAGFSPACLEQTDTTRVSWVCLGFLGGSHWVLLPACSADSLGLDSQVPGTWACWVPAWVAPGQKRRGREIREKRNESVM